MGDEVVPVLSLLETSEGHLGTCIENRIRNLVIFLMSRGCWLTRNVLLGVFKVLQRGDDQYCAFADGIGDQRQRTSKRVCPSYKAIIVSTRFLYHQGLGLERNKC